MSDPTDGQAGWRPVPDGTTPGWGPGSAAPTQGQGPAPAGYEVLAAYTPTPAPSRTRPGALVAIGVGVAAALVATLFAVTSLGANDGAATPEAAVERLFDAVSNEDLVGVLESLTPGERSAMLPGIRGVASELQRLRILSDDLDLGGLSGIEFDVAGLELASEGLGPGVAGVAITAGTITSTFEPASLPIGDNLAALLDLADLHPADLEPDTTTEDLSEGDVHIAVIEEGGGWHVSLLYSIAEAARRDAGLPVPAFGAGVAAAGASSPEAVVEELAAAATRLDLRRAIALLAPDEMRALQDYAPLFLDEVEAERDEWLADEDVELTIDRLDLETDRDGDTAFVSISGFAIRGTVVGETGSAGFDGDCFRFTDGTDEEEHCLSDDQELDLGRDIDHTDLRLGVTVVERDGAWYLSPVRTSVELTLASLRLLEPQDLEGEDSPFGHLMGMFVFGAVGTFVGVGAHEDVGYEYEYDDEYGDDSEHSSGTTSSPGQPGRPDQQTLEICYAPVDELPDGASEAEWEAAYAEVEECLYG
jgi:hypothetical protein